MPADIFICGECQVIYHDINAFLQHKQKECIPAQGDGDKSEGDTPQTEVQGPIYIIQEASGEDIGDDGASTDVSVFQQQSTDTSTVYETTTTQILSADTGTDGQQSVILPIITALAPTQADDGTSIELVPVSGSTDPDISNTSQQTLSTLAGGTARPIDLQILVKSERPSPVKQQTKPQPISTYKPTGRPRGRPKKVKKIETETTPQMKKEKPEDIREKPLEKGPDGLYHCGGCKRAFPKERHMRTHRCLAHSDYIDLLLPVGEQHKGDDLSDVDALSDDNYDAKQDDDVSDDDDDNMDDDKEEEFRPSYTPRGRGRGRPRGSRGGRGRGRPRGSFKKANPPKGVVYINANKLGEEGNSNKGEESGAVEGGAIETQAPVEPPPETEMILPILTVNGTVNDVRAGDGENVDEKPATAATTERDMVTEPKATARIVMLADEPMMSSDGVTMATDVTMATEEGGEETEKLQEAGTVDRDRVGKMGSRIADLPIFKTDEDKLAFEQCINVDFDADIEHLYKVHAIDQDMNDLGPPITGKAANQLTVFSCNVCEKVFMTLSHAKTHCIIHTEIKPYKCFKCDYATNSKGNLYTHMRKHTGQMYQCTECSFSAANRSHLIDHEATHRNEKHPCKICKHSYNTRKSLINHVRRYHGKTKEGAEYLGTMQGKHKKGPAVLHQCHVCNRKFKKKVDRDRHLIVHNICDTGIYICRICQHTSARKEYFLKHIARHRVLYRCVVCNLDHPSCKKLNDHLLVQHLNESENKEEELQDMFDKSINNSLFLPEPDGSIDWLVDGTLQEDQQQHEESLGETDNAADNNDMETVAENLDADNQMDISESNIEKSAENSEVSTETDKESPEETSAPEESSQQSDTCPKQELPLLDPMSSVAEVPATDIETYLAVGYKPMTVDILAKLRQTFGEEECEFCGRLFFKNKDYLLHLTTHTGDKPYKCTECEFSTTTSTVLRQHIEREHHNIMYMCRVCGHSARSVAALMRHQQQKHEAITAAQTTQQGLALNPAQQAITCTLCDETVIGVKLMKTHLESTHPEMSKEEITQHLAPFQKKPQGKIGRKSYQCPYCERTFTRGSTDLQKHIWIHQGVKPFQCQQCDYACRSKSNLAAHMIRHSADKPLLCTHCGKGYKSKTALRWHIRSHTDGKIFKCAKCPYEATQKCHLKRHMETHNVVKRYVCELCDYSANTVGYMKIHYTRHHKGRQFNHTPVYVKPMSADTKVYRCLSCDYMFGNLSDMKRHLRVRHHLATEDMRSLEVLESPQAEGAGPVVSGEGDIDTQQLIIGGEPLAEGETVITEDGMATSQHIQVIQMSDSMTSEGTTVEQDGSLLQQTLHYSTVESDVDVDEKTASAVSALQHIMDTAAAASNAQGELDTSYDPQQQQELSLQTIDTSQSGGLETIIVQHGQEVVLTSSDSGATIEGDPTSGQYVIQYVMGDDGQAPAHLAIAPISQQEVMSSQEVVNVTKQEVTTENLAETAFSIIQSSENTGTVVTTSESGQILHLVSDGVDSQQDQPMDTD